MTVHTTHWYRCNHCGKTVLRDSEKRWIKSYCDEAGRSTRLWRLAREQR